MPIDASPTKKPDGMTTCTDHEPSNDLVDDAVARGPLSPDAVAAICQPSRGMCIWHTSWVDNTMVSPTLAEPGSTDMRGTQPPLAGPGDAHPATLPATIASTENAAAPLREFMRSECQQTEGR